MYTNPGRVYELANRLAIACRTHGYSHIAQQLDDAPKLGSSVIEILGEIQTVLRAEADTLEKYADRSEIDVAILYIDHVFGRN